MALQDVVGKSPDGNISPSLILGRAMKDQAGKRRMARGKGGDLGDYAYIGQEFLKEQPSSGTAERSAIIHGVAHAACPRASSCSQFRLRRPTTGSAHASLAG